MEELTAFAVFKAYVLANRGKYAPIARRGFEVHGRGVVIPELSRSNLGSVGRDTYWPMDMVYAVSERAVIRELVENYDPLTEFVVLIASRDGRSGLIKMNLEGTDQ
jgi:hypothetical protein